MKGARVDDIVEPAVTRLKGRCKIGKCQTDLSREVRFS